MGSLRERWVGPRLELADCVLALHATDPASVFLSVAARSADLRAADVAAALYDDRTLIRMLGMRRTMFVVPTPAAPTVQCSASIAVAARLRAALVKDLAAVIAQPDGWLSDVEDAVVKVLHDTGARPPPPRCRRTAPANPSSTRKGSPTAGRRPSAAGC